jgi:hypothetical protein
MIQVTPFLRILGWFGTTCIMTAYALNSFGIIPSLGFWYPFINLIGALTLGIRVYADRNWANVTLEVFFFVVALIALIRLLM